MKGCPPCDLRNLDYSLVERGAITCRACGWGWRLNLDPDDGPMGWRRCNPQTMSEAA